MLFYLFPCWLPDRETGPKAKTENGEGSQKQAGPGDRHDDGKNGGMKGRNAERTGKRMGREAESGPSAIWNSS